MRKTIVVSMEGSKDALEKTEKEIQRILNEHTNSPHSTALPLMKSTISDEVHVIVGVWGGVVNDVRPFSSKDFAEEYERWLCESYEIPFDEKARSEQESDGDILNWKAKIDELKPPKTNKKDDLSRGRRGSELG
jgi:endogenous inhibitor of DNA gyrase (YacG/DUF329 family)